MASQVTFPSGSSEPTSIENDLMNLPPPESGRDKFFRKMKEQPLVPIGSLLTCGALIAASHHLRKGNRDQFQKALRWRVGLQGLTVVGAVAGSVYYGAAATKPADSSAGGSEVTTGDKNSTLSSISVMPGRPATNLQANRAEEKKEADRAMLAERLREAIAREEREKLEREEISKQLATADGKKPRPKIGQDSRWSWRNKEETSSSRV